MRLLPHFPKLSYTAGVIALSVLCSLTTISAKELVGTPVPLPASAQPAKAPHAAPMPSSPAALTAEHSAMEQMHAAGDEADIVRNMERMFEDGMGDDHSETINLDFIIPLVAMLLIFGGPIFLIGFLMVLNYRNKRHREANTNMNIDKLLAAGRDIPVELLRGDEPSTANADDTGDDGSLNKGIKNICVGTGLLIFLTIFMGIKIGSVAFILIGLGVSRVIVWKLGQTNKTQSQPIQAQD